MIKAIETRYKGYRFRSRLEARWAVFFDALGARWEYEKEGYDLGPAGWYLPDFWLSDLGVWLEVKGVAPTFEERQKCAHLCEHTGAPVAMVSGEVWWNVFDYFFALDAPHKGYRSAVDCAGRYVGDDYEYNWPDKSEYYQGWVTFGMVDGIDIVTLVESDDRMMARDPRIARAFAAARAARFEHGERP